MLVGDGDEAAMQVSVHPDDKESSVEV